MNQQASRLAERLATFNNELITWVEGCPEKAWQTGCSEDWSLGVVAHHIGAGHYSEVIELTRMIVAGQPLPEFTMDELTQAANDHAREHANCTKAEVLTLLREKGDMLSEYAATLSDEDLNRKANVALLGGEVTAGQFLEALILQSAQEHFTSMKAALG